MLSLEGEAVLYLLFQDLFKWSNRPSFIGYQREGVGERGSRLRG
jgi:hypothetical protein